jgi:diguanylate cyclase (GGDEF)-like protein/PAS domain S-box-containing protein
MPAREPNQRSQNDRASIRGREYRAIAFLLVLGMVVWMVESFLYYLLIQEDYLFAWLRADLSVHAMFVPLVGVACFIGYGIYVTRIMIAVKRTEQELQESEERYRLLTHNSLSGIYILVDATLVYVNDRLAEIMGWSAQELVGKKFRDFVHPDDRELVEEREKARSLGKTVVAQYEFRLVCKNGDTKWVEVLAAGWTHLGREGSMGNVADITERKKHETERERLICDLENTREALHFQATHDALTGLLNRAAVLDGLAREVARASREGGSLTVILAYLYHFNNINYTYGHLAGDAVLIEVARRVRSSVRSYDLAGRYGGEELLIALPGCDETGAAHFSERIRSAVCGEPVETPDGAVQVTISLGVTTTKPPGRRDLDQILREADKALYEAKESGRNCVVMVSRDLSVDAVQSSSA